MWGKHSPAADAVAVFPEQLKMGIPEEGPLLEVSVSGGFLTPVKQNYLEVVCLLEYISLMMYY